MWDFEHEPERSHLRERYQIGYTTPSGCAEELAAGVIRAQACAAACSAAVPT